MKKLILTSAVLITAFSSCKKCYTCRIVKTSPPVQGVQWQSSVDYVDFCGNKKDFEAFKEDMQGSGVVQIGNTTYYHKNVVDCNEQ